MTPTQAREKRRTVVEDLRASLRTISAGNACLRSIEACEAMATAYQCVGRLQAIDEQECYGEACSLGRPARSPRPSIIPEPAMSDLAAFAEAARLTDLDPSKPMSWAEQQARLPYVPESIAITPEMETDSARRMAFEAAMMLPPDDAERQAELAEAWDRGDDGAIREIVGQVKLNGRP